eukprot:Gb_31300 [translate_table: standard]
MKEKVEEIERMQSSPQAYGMVQSDLLPQFHSSLTKQHPHQPQNEQQSDQIPQTTNRQQFGSDLAQLVPSPISTRPPQVMTMDGFKQPVPVSNNALADDDSLAEDDFEKGSAGSRWPRQETLALLKIRSEMDAAFRDASLKAPLWEDISRRLSELGYHRSAKKCKEKFENVYKYYKRTKGGRSGRQDGKSYRFFSQLEAMYGNATNSIDNIDTNNNGGRIKNNNNNNNNMATAGASRVLQAGDAADGLQRDTEAPSMPTQRPSSVDFSAMSFLYESSEDDSDDDDDNHNNAEMNRKRKRSFTKTTMKFFDKLMKKVMEKQEMMQQRFLEMIEKREQDRLNREEAWKRREIARLNREDELRSQERALAASRDKALVAFLQRVTGQTLELPQLPVSQAIPAPTQENHCREEFKENEGIDPNSKRWPKPEVLALIKLRSGLELKFHDTGPKAQLWEQISSEMARLGYRRSAKRCKEKWENINKYFRKAKESNKERPENANTCPYFHQLDALYRKGILGNSSERLNRIRDQDQLEELAEQTCGSNRDDQSPHGCTDGEILAIMPAPEPDCSTAAAPAPVAVPTSNGVATFFSSDQEDVDGGERALKKVKMKQSNDNIEPDYNHQIEGDAFSGNYSKSRLKPDSARLAMIQAVQSTLKQSLMDGYGSSMDQGRDNLVDDQEKHEKQADLDLPYAVYDDRTNSASNNTRDASFMAMVHKLAADPPEFNVSACSNTE